MGGDESLDPRDLFEPDDVRIEIRVVAPGRPGTIRAVHIPTGQSVEIPLAAGTPASEAKIEALRRLRKAVGWPPGRGPG